jgi:DNA-binding transcriptional ArsR family regulator
MPRSPSKDFSPVQLQGIAEMFASLADGSRLTILNTLRTSPAFVSELCRRTGLKQANVSKQLKVLRMAGLVESQRVGNQIRYQVREPMVFDLCDLVCRRLRRDARRRVAMLQ